MENGAHAPRRNGAGSTRAPDDDTQTVNPEILPRYDHAPAHIPGSGCVVVRKEIVFGLGGVVLGAWGMYLLMQALRERR